MPAVAIGAGIVGSALIGSSAAKKAGKTVANATDQAAALQNQQFEKLLQLQMPGYNRGEQAASVYMQALGIPSMTGSGAKPGVGTPVAGTTQYGAATQDPILNIADQVMQTPGYQTQLDQGLKSIDRAAPLTGGMYSGRRMKALNDYGQNTFGAYYDNWLNRVGGVAGQGQQVAQNVGQAGMQNAQNVGGLMVQGANAKAQGSLNSAAAWTNAMNTGLGMVGGAKGWF